MASIVSHGDGWRAHVCVKGKRDSQAGFRTKREAQAWATDKEREFSAGGSAITFEVAADRWLKWKLPRLTNADFARAIEQSVRDYMLPRLGKLQVAQLRRRDLVAVVTAVEEAGHAETAKRVGQRICAILDHCVDHGDIESHPGARLSRVLSTPAAIPQPAVSPGELPALLQAIDRYPEPVTRIGLLLMAHTFLRTRELVGGEWSELIPDDPVWFVPGERMKIDKRPHVVPLSREVQALFTELRAMTGESRFMLASSINRACPISKNTLLFALYRLGYRGRMTGHGFRAVASTVLNQSGLWNPSAIERQLAHKESDAVRAAYHRADYLEERRRMMQWWSSYLADRTASTSS